MRRARSATPAVRGALYHLCSCAVRFFLRPRRCLPRLAPPHTLPAHHSPLHLKQAGDARAPVRPGGSVSGRAVATGATGRKEGGGDRWTSSSSLAAQIGPPAGRPRASLTRPRSLPYTVSCTAPQPWPAPWRCGPRSRCQSRRLPRRPRRRAPAAPSPPSASRAPTPTFPSSPPSCMTRRSPPTPSPPPTSTPPPPPEPAHH